MSNFPPQYLNTITTGDNRALAGEIPTGSVDLIFSDPVYENAEDYVWIARLADRVLKPNGVLLVFVGLSLFEQTFDAVRAGGFSHRWSLGGVYPNLKKYAYGKLLVCKTEVWWLERRAERGQTILYDHVADMTQLPYDRDVRYLQATGASWDKHPKQIKRYSQAFCPPGGLILDPFAGTGQIPVYGRALGFDVAGFEIKPEVAEMGRKRLGNLPPVLCDETGAQMGLDVEVRSGRRRKPVRTGWGVDGDPSRTAAEPNAAATSGDPVPA